MPELSNGAGFSGTAGAFLREHNSADRFLAHDVLPPNDVAERSVASNKPVAPSESKPWSLRRPVALPVAASEYPLGWVRPAGWTPPGQRAGSSHRQPQLSGGYAAHPLARFRQPPPPRVDTEESDDCDDWVNGFLDRLPAIKPGDSPPPPPLPTAAPPAQPLSSTCFPFRESRPPPFPHFPAPNVPITPSVRFVHSPSSTIPATPPASFRGEGISTRRPSRYQDAQHLSPTPTPLRPRGGLRCPKATDKFTRKVAPNAEQLEHVRRERQRRDDMSFKIATLESLLPSSASNAKRDRASIVHESVQHVQSLQQEVDELKRTLSELKLSKSEGTARPRVESHEMIMPDPDGRARLAEYHVHVHGQEESTARMDVCRCRPDHMSAAMEVFEQLNLEVCRCTITKMGNYTMCVVVAKPRQTSGQVATPASTVNALRSCLQL